ncbi:putative metallophosphoesterase YunD [Marinithermofilum abyssi]|uniref:Putative metallophosphoesterase YunD n=1 Tax=Marinithermofilum abyssi TaxID=1571185 RepID=A0A8J2YD73_9BACL|nr:bifunctional UDP-sugar hydrolase/5'-nucleotidase [Marinithermofilum abyssi]GGE07554.1 putative metallophosphoesterase YunD [Marinithermofilum abyssi]
MKSRKRVRILHTNDIHSHFEQMPRICTWVKRRQAEAEARGETSILADVGDHMDRVRKETEGTGGLANYGVLEATGYRLITLGNNELLTFSKEELNRLYRESPFSVLATNVEELEGSRPEWIRPWTIVDTDECRLGFLGVTIPFPEFYRLLGWHVKDPWDVLALEVPRLRKEVDVIVVLSHLGLPNDRRLAKEIPGIDVILGGHTHHLLKEPERIGDTLVAAAGKFGQYAGEVVLDWDAETRRIKKMEAGVFAMAAEVPDRGLEEQIARSRYQAELYLKQPISQLDQPLPIDWYHESPLGNFLADGLRAWVKADIALVNAGQLLDGLDAGPVSLGRLHEICPHPINPCRINLKGRQIRALLETSLQPEVQQMEIKGFGFRGKRLGMLNVAGMEVVYEPTGVAGQQVREVTIEGKVMEDEAVYSVASIDMFTFGIGYPEVQNGTDLRYFLPEFLRNVLAWHLGQPESVALAYRTRWRQWNG